MQQFVNSLEHIQISTYWNGVLISLFEISLLLLLFFAVLFHILKKKVECESIENFALKAGFALILFICFLITFSIILSFNLKKEAIETNYSNNDSFNYRYVEKLDGDFIKVPFTKRKLDESKLTDGFTYKINKYGEFYEIPINRESFDKVEFKGDNNLCVSRAYIENLDTSDGVVYATISNLGNVTARNFIVKIVYENNTFSNLKDFVKIESLDALSSKLIEFKIDTSKINKIENACLKIYIVYDKDTDISNNCLNVSYYKQ